MQKNNSTLSFSDLAISRRKIKSEFFNQINNLLDWTKIEKIITKHYVRGESVVGRPSYSGLLLFKMSLLQTWYGLSDYEVEDRVNDCLSFMKFVGLSLEDDVPDHSVLSRFRKDMTEKGAYERLLKHINDELEKKRIVLKTGLIVDASITDTPRKPRGKAVYEITEDRNEIDETTRKDGDSDDVTSVPPQRKVQSHVDPDGAWIKKNGKLRYGFKKHVGTDNNGLVLSVITTPANESDIKHLAEVIEKSDLPKGARVRADKGYSSEENRKYLKEHGYKSGIMHKAKRGTPLNNQQKKFNKIVSKTRYKIERTFGGIKRWFASQYARYVGIKKMHTQHVLEAIAYNLYRSPGIIMSKP